jgi:hypothetical protein
VTTGSSAIASRAAVRGAKGQGTSSGDDGGCGCRVSAGDSVPGALIFFRAARRARRAPPPAALRPGQSPPDPKASYNRLMTVRVRWVAISALTIVGVTVACGSSDGSGDVVGNGGGAGTAAAGGSAASAGLGGSSASGGGVGGGGIIIDSGSDDGGLTDASACAAESKKAELLPLDLYIMLDKSGSMQGSKWSSVTSAIDAFVKDPQSAGLGVGLDFFPDNPECSIGTYSTPSVPIALLPGNQPAISAGSGRAEARRRTQLSRARSPTRRPMPSRIRRTWW